MEPYFTPVQRASQEDAKLRKPQHHHNPHHHRQQLRQPQHHHYPHEKTPRRPGSGDNHVHHQAHHRDHNVQGYHSLDNPKVDDPHTLDRSPSSSSLSTSSTASSSWSSEQSLYEPYPMHKPQHSLSCSNIAEPRYKIPDWDSEDMEFDMKSSMPFEQPRSPHHQPHQHTHSHPHTRGQSSRPHSSRSEGHGHGARLSRLHRGQSKSEEGLLHSIDSDEEEDDGWGRHPPAHQGALYKTTSLGQNLAFGGDSAMLGGGTAMPKKSVSTIQLPTKGILKNRDGGSSGNQRSNFRKAKSMEVLSSQQKAGKAGASSATVEGTGNQKTMGIEDFVKAKLQFSAFLDEITRQVISPSRLNSLGVTPGSSPTSPAPKSPNQERKESCSSTKQEETVGVQQSKQNRSGKSGNHSSTKSSSDSQSQSHSSYYSGKQHATSQEAGNRPRSGGHHHHHGNHKKRHSGIDPQGVLGDKQHQGQNNNILTDGTSTSPETALHEPKHHHPKQHDNNHGITGGGQSPPRQPQGDHKGSPPPSAQAPGPDSESPSSKSSSASHSSGHRATHGHRGHRRHSKSHRQDSVGSVDRVQLLEQYNKELHENLLQTVACIENMETELQCTKTELGSLRDKYKRLQDSYTTCQQSSTAIEQKLQSATESMNSERRYLLHRILELTRQLDLARHTINSLENVNVPALIKELLHKHFKSEDDLKTFLRCTTLKDNMDNQSTWTALDVASHDWSLPRQGSSESGSMRMAAFMPWGQDSCEWAATAEEDVTAANSRIQPFPFTVAEIRMALFNNTKKIPSEVLKERSSSVIEVPPNPYEDTVAIAEAAGGEDMGKATAAVAEEEEEVSSATAQKILDNFISQMSSLSSTESPEQKGSSALDWTGSQQDSIDQ